MFLKPALERTHLGTFNALSRGDPERLALILAHFVKDADLSGPQNRRGFCNSCLEIKTDAPPAGPVGFWYLLLYRSGEGEGVPNIDRGFELYGESSEIFDAAPIGQPGREQRCRELAHGNWCLKTGLLSKSGIVMKGVKVSARPCKA